MRRTVVLIFPLICALLCSCATVRTLKEQKIYNAARLWTPSDLSEGIAGNDPLEPFNRCMFALNDGMMHYVVRPVSWVYGSIMPLPVIEHLSSASENLAFPARMISCFCQAKFKNGGIVLLRFLTNSTIGIVGLFDPAYYWFNLPPQNEYMGKALASWGIPPGCVLVLPGSSAFNCRDQVGWMLDLLLDLKMVMPYGSSWVFRINYMVLNYDKYDNSTNTLADAYDLAKTGMNAYRYGEVREWNLKPLPFIEKKDRKKVLPEKTDVPGKRVIHIRKWYGEGSPEISTMKYTMFQMQRNHQSWWVKSSLWNSDFVSKVQSYSVELKKDAPELPYQIWTQEDPTAPLLVLLPGIGSHYKNPQLRALAEMMYLQGYSVLVSTSTFNPLFMEAAQNYLPGNTPHDAAILRDALRKILDDVQKRTGIRPRRTHLSGYSMGGLHALFIADMERKKPILKIDRYVAVNPPVDLKYALEKFDQLHELVKTWDRNELYRQGIDAMMKFMAVSGRQYSRISKKNPTGKENIIPLTRKQAAILAGFSFRLTLRDILLTAKRNQPEMKAFKTPYSWSSRSELYREIDAFNGMAYAKNFLLPEFRKKYPLANIARMNRQFGLRSIAATLSKHPNIRVIHNLDDPLLSSSDRKFLSDTLEERITWFDCGGHLGNMFVKEYQDFYIHSFPPAEKADKPHKKGEVKP